MAKQANAALIDTRVIYCGDNLEQLKKLPEKCVDLVYIDPPFNSNRSYEVFWGESQEQRSFEDRHDSTQAYIDFMRPRCVELHRILKESGCMYFHCDWHAAHYIKIMLDQIFSEKLFVNEIIWKRQSAHNDSKQGSRHLGRVHDTIFLYAKSDNYKFNHQFRPYNIEYVEKFYKHIEPNTGRRFSLGDLGAPGGAAPSKGNPYYEFMGVKRYWRYSKDKMHDLFTQGRIVQSKPGAVPRQKRYLDEGKGVPIGTIWDDVNPIQAQSLERIGYPTQKPLSLLDRIISLSTDPNDVILDAFCGCGTALVSAELSGRRWVGIDISPKACCVVGKRLEVNCRLKDDEALWKARRGYQIRGLPWTELMLKKLPHYEFESWAVIALGGIPNKTKVHDWGIDGRIYPTSDLPENFKGEVKGQMDFMGMWYPVQVKQKAKVGRPDIDQFEAVMMRANRHLGIYVAFGYSQDAIEEASKFFKRSGRRIIPITVNEILNNTISKKLA